MTLQELRQRRMRLTPAIALNWTSSTVRVLCPFASCGLMHEHGYTRPRSWLLNSRLSHCKKYQQEYRILFPFGEEDEVQGLGVELDRYKGRWRTVGGGFQDLDEVLAEAKNREYTLGEDLNIQMANMTFEETTQEDRFFLSYAVSNELRSLQDLLQATSNPERLIRLRNKQGNNALTLACMEGHRDVVQLLVEKGADIENINAEGKTPLMESLCFGHGRLSEFLILEGASTSAKDAEGTSPLDFAKQTLETLEEDEWILSRTEHETYERYLQRKGNRDAWSGSSKEKYPGCSKSFEYHVKFYFPI